MCRPIRVQIVSRYLPTENLVGHYTYLLDFMCYLRRAGCILELIVFDQWLRDGDIPPAVQEIADVRIRKPGQSQHELSGFGSLFVKVKTVSRPYFPRWLIRIARKGRHWIDRNDVSDPKTWDALPTKAESDFAQIRFTEFKPDVVIANYAFLGGILDIFSNNTRVLKVILTYDIRHQRVKSYEKAGYRSNDSAWNWENESELLRKTDVILAIQEDEARTLKEMAPQSEVLCMPMARRYSPYLTIAQVPGRCLFVGSNVDHNVYGLRWFLKDIWPKIVRQVPHCRLHVCGSVCQEIHKEFPYMNFLGRVDDLEPEYAAAEVCLIPLVVGSGLKIKLVEALSHGRACVSTSVGVQGVRELTNKAVLVADTVEGFAEAVITVLTNPEKRKEMEDLARKYVEENLSPEKVYQPLVDRIYQHISEI